MKLLLNIIIWQNFETLWKIFIKISEHLAKIKRKFHIFTFYWYLPVLTYIGWHFFNCQLASRCTVIYSWISSIYEICPIFTNCTTTGCHDCKTWVCVEVCLHLSNFCRSTSFDLLNRSYRYSVDGDSMDVKQLLLVRHCPSTKICDQPLVDLNQKSWTIFVLSLYCVDVNYLFTLTFWCDILILPRLFYPISNRVKGQ